MVDDAEADEEGIVDVVLDDNAIRQVPRPGTSLRSAAASSGGPSQAYRPTTQSGKSSNDPISNYQCCEKYSFF
jgi:tetratricopeptide repeat protein 8